MRQALRELLLEGRLHRRGHGIVVAGPELDTSARHVAGSRVPRPDAGFEPDSSFCSCLHDRAGVSSGDADERIETVLATPREALLVGTPPALPMLLIHRPSRDAGGQPPERVRTLFRGDRFSSTVRLGDRG